MIRSLIIAQSPGFNDAMDSMTPDDLLLLIQNRSHLHFPALIRYAPARTAQLCQQTSSVSAGTKTPSAPAFGRYPIHMQSTVQGCIHANLSNSWDFNYGGTGHQIGGYY